MGILPMWSHKSITVHSIKLFFFLFLFILLFLHLIPLLLSHTFQMPSSFYSFSLFFSFLQFKQTSTFARKNVTCSYLYCGAISGIKYRHTDWSPFPIPSSCPWETYTGNFSSRMFAFKISRETSSSNEILCQHSLWFLSS